jgi:hypothetical protein
MSIGRIDKILVDDKCKTTRVILSGCPTVALSGPTLSIHRDPPLQRVTDPRSQVYVLKCPTPEMPPTSSPPLVSKGLFFIRTNGRIYYLHFDGDPPYTGVQDLGAEDTGLGEDIYHLDVDQVRQTFFSIETTGGSIRKIRKRTYTITDAGVVTLGSPTQLVSTDGSVEPFIERISLARDKGFLFVGTGVPNSSFNYSVTKRDYNYNLLQLIRSEGGTGTRWLVVDNQVTNILYRRLGIGFDNTHDIREVDPDTLVMNQLFEPPSPTTTSSHEVAAEKLVGKLFEFDGSNIYETAFPTPVSYNVLYGVPGGGGGMTILPVRGKLVFSEHVNGKIRWMNFDGTGLEDIWTPSDDGLSNSDDVERISGGVA